MACDTGRVNKPVQYFVWRRNDGYIGATAGYMPRGYTQDSGDQVTFVELLNTTDWIEARERIETEREKQYISTIAFG